MKAMPNLMETELETLRRVDRSRTSRGSSCSTPTPARCAGAAPACARPTPPASRSTPARSCSRPARSWPRTGTPPVSPPIGVDREITVSANSLFERITPEEVWACTSCKACDEICPVNIEILDKILDMRRYLSLMESNFPTELGNAYRAMENSGNPWGMNQGERGDWAAKARGRRDRRPGRAPSTTSTSTGSAAPARFDDKNKKVTQAMAKLLQRAGIDFAILGPSEMCTGDSARRSGNEYIFQMLAMQNIEIAQRHGREEDHHAVPALLQHAVERVPAARRQLRGRPPQPVPRVADRDGPARRERRHARGADHLPRLLLPRPPQRRLPRAPQGDRLARRHRGRRGAAATAPRACAAAPAAPACGWRRPSARRSTTSAARS